MFSFQCSLVWFYEQTNMSLLFLKTTEHLLTISWNLEIISRGISSIMIHQIFLLLCDWPKCIMLTYIPLLKLGDTRDYHPSHTHQFSNLTFATISLQVKFGYRWLLQKKGNTCLFIKLYGRNLIRKHPMKKQ